MAAIGFTAWSDSVPCRRPSAAADRTSLDRVARLSPADSSPRTAVKRPPARVQAAKTPAASAPWSRSASSITVSIWAVSLPLLGHALDRSAGTALGVDQAEQDVDAGVDARRSGRGEMRAQVELDLAGARDGEGLGARHAR